MTETVVQMPLYVVLFRVQMNHARFKSLEVSGFSGHKKTKGAVKNSQIQRGCKKTVRFKGPRFHIRDLGPFCNKCILKMGYYFQIR